MSDGTQSGQPQSNTLDVLTGVFIIVQIVLCYFVVFVFGKSTSITLSYIIVALIALSFILYLFGIIKDTEDRNFIVAATFILSNVASIVLLFANIYRWIGLNDTLRPGFRCPSQVCSLHLQECDAHHLCQLTSIWDAIYFSLITLTTVGYGDVIPTLHARSAAAFEAITGYVVLGLVISVLMTLAKPYSD